ncbi:MAG: hypothetical protein JSU08_14970 [Acidobacteria bacterium]|nr:hypothetical protein [Acidobacteriota bacterium]
MRILLALLLLVAMAPTARAQQGTGAAGAAAGSAPDGQETTAQDGELPVSLDRIREKLADAGTSRLKNVEVKPDFSVHVEDRRHFDEILSKLDFRSGPAPAGGLYGYEQQRQLFNPLSSPLQQPYAAYNAGQFFTIALQNLFRVYLTDRLKAGVAAARQTRDEAAARREVDADIAAWCSTRPDRNQIQLCTPAAER